MKKFLAMLLSVMLIATLAVGCGGNGDDADTADTDVTADDGGDAPDADVPTGDAVTLSLLSWNSEAVMGPYIEAFEAEFPHITIDLQFVPPVQQYVERFNVLVASGEMPDMFYTAGENLTDIVERGLAVDLSDMAIFDRIDPYAAATWGNDGAIYGFAPDAWIAGIMYNEEIFAEAGITDIPTTWMSLLKFVEG